MNAAYVFVKPHACTDAGVAQVKSYLEGKGIKIVCEGTITGPQIDEHKYIDQHYYAIACKATLKKPHEIVVPTDTFEAKFGEKWDAVKESTAFNALDACAKLGITADDLDKKWGEAKKADQLVKFGGGFYCAKIDDLYIFNGFFMSMRSKFTDPSVKIHYFSVQFDESAIAWSDFRGKLLGPTDPATAAEDSLRGIFYKDWEKFGLSEIPNTGDNAVHASASPFEGLAERLNWLGAKVEDDVFGKVVLAAGISKETVTEWSVDPRVEWTEGGEKKASSLFDALEDMDATACLEQMKKIAGL